MEIDHDNAELLAALPSHISITPLLKATPMTEGGKRYVYVEASSEDRDQQNEIILAKALEASAEYYKKFGNLDIDHFTQLGKPNPAKGWPGLPNAEMFEIGRPVEVCIEKKRTFVKGEISSGVGPASEKANMFWSSLMDINPPQRWYPSVGGAVIKKEVHFDPEKMSKCAVISEVRWTNIGFSKTPVNANLATVQTAPFGPLAKSWGALGGFGMDDMVKSLTAGYGTDSAALTGGAALRVQSLDGGVHSYWDFRDAFADAFKRGDFAGLKLPALVQVAQSKFGVAASDAAEFVERFLVDLQNALKEKRR